MKSKAQEWADERQSRNERIAVLRRKIRALELDSCPLSLKLQPVGYPCPLDFEVASDAGLQVSGSGGDLFWLSRLEALQLAEWIVDTFGAPPEAAS